MTRHIGIVLFDDVEELDAVGPWEVLAAWTRRSPDDGYEVSCLSRSGGAGRGRQGAHDLARTIRSTDAPAVRRARSTRAAREPARSWSIPSTSSGCARSAPPYR